MRQHDPGGEGPGLDEVGEQTDAAVRSFQKKIGMSPADGYAGVTLLARLREAR